MNEAVLKYGQVDYRKPNSTDNSPLNVVCLESTLARARDLL
jgi:hypothetical protein